MTCTKYIIGIIDLILEYPKAVLKVLYIHILTTDLSRNEYCTFRRHKKAFQANRVHVRKAHELRWPERISQYE